MFLIPLIPSISVGRVSRPVNPASRQLPNTRDFFDLFGPFDFFDPFEFFEFFDPFNRKPGTLARLCLRLLKLDAQECPSYGSPAFRALFAP